jgi:hypothetical protein
VIRDGQWIAIATTAKLELALEVGTPEIIRGCPLRQRRAARAMARPAAPPDQAVTIEHRMDGAFGWNPDVAVQPPHQERSDLARAPVRLLGFEPDDQGLELLGKLVGVAHRPAGAVAQCRQPVLLVPIVPIENLVAGFAGDAELPADIRHPLAVQQAGDKTQAFFHDRTRSPRHLHPPPKRRKV